MLRFSSIRNRIFALFSLSILAFGGAFLYALIQQQNIGQGLDALNRSYLPLVANIAQLQGDLRQLDLEHQRISRGGPTATTEKVESILTIKKRLKKIAIEVDMSLNQKELAQERKTLIALSERIDGAKTQITAYQNAISTWKISKDDLQLNTLQKARTALAVEVGQIGALVRDRVEEVGKSTAIARERTYLFGGILAGLAGLLSVALVGVALRTLEPIGKLTKQVQKLGHGDYTQKLMKAPKGVGEEVVVLAREINAMAEAVIERDRRLKERAFALDQLSLRLQQALNTIHSGLMVIESGAIDMVNPSATREWGVRPGSPPPKALLAFEIGRHAEVSVGDRIFDVDVAPFGEKGHLISAEDVTEKVRVREQLSRTKRLAMVGRMLAQVTHEVRNPLNAMSLNAEMLEDEMTSDEGQEMLAIISTEIRRLESITERYLALSRRRQLTLTEERPILIAKDVLRSEQAVLEKQKVSVSIEGKESLATIDAQALGRVLRNLLRNAIEAEADRIQITVSAIKNGQIVMTVQDNGEGMDEEQIQQVFDPFYTTKAKGTGLGLVISQQELEEFGATINCTSEKGKFSRFTLTLPAAIDNLTTDENLS